ncbi:hypothetical protein SCHPADRAFT_937674 [Schizopora paradoxa]|uniref:Ser-Thr-rich glycosyl-phosphatidyl-inositol-anchored membrane family-domain-containing protein n=1 Tax=Schizopora paradoxa TaxID=27342 RepID=A0A0H2RYD8_9AGAM|nr:hypothetical protein SCHPADRAFT_937674 [Schizopora paradoxa]
MYFSRIAIGFVASLFLASPSLAAGSTYFKVNTPSQSTAWINGQTNLLQWTKGLLDGVNAMDIELARLSADGVWMIAANAPANSGKLDIALQNLPPADDYFLLFLNSTHGVMYGSSQRFSILAAGSTPTNGSSPSPASGVPTITLQSTPDPNLLFATVFPAIANGAWRSSVDAGAPLLLAALTCLLSALWTLML